MPRPPSKASVATSGSRGLYGGDSPRRNLPRQQVAE
eukprot:CAMPEP_0202767086 /NCGR_PEP_ID=MMETSP1388-20130828/31953_1 /ASSEMBLY_ACC=CAM_ASM_000864 /TAXON_ID=37098 /ORGANISM="Isochrysis sp, Strain CCMP1244" /LENGTH=35 /DNA_ID= /DNA_START= /DNA_END= /DNA_ORIENTATION=